VGVPTFVAPGHRRMILSITDEQLAAAEGVLAGRASATVLAAMSPQQPDALMRAVLSVARRREVRLTFAFADLYGSFAFLDDQAVADIERGQLRLKALAGAVPRRWSQVTDYLQCSLWDVTRLLAARVLPIDIVLARVQMSSRTGYAEFGEMVGYTPAALTTNAAAVFEIVDEAGPTGLRSAQVVPLDRAEIVLPTGDNSRQMRIGKRSTPEQGEIGRLVASLIPDEATLQLGLGSFCEAVVPHLCGKRELGLHSGILAPSLNRLIKSGVITGGAKSSDAGVAVATGIFSDAGSPAEDWGDLAELRPISATHDPRVLLGQQRLWAVNSAIEVDLAGQVNAEFVDGVRIASGGGQSDFVRAAHASDGGAAVIALPSRTRQGRSRLVSRLSSNNPPTVTGQDVDFVVTEYGVAALRGLSAGERGVALAGIAHPDDRERVYREFKHRGGSA
jgi:4-hydroxybutyrate CoA-transferase